MNKAYFLLALSIFLLCTTNLFAQEFAYVTDSLQLRLYSQATDSSEVLVSITSGDSVEVLEAQGAFSKVVTNEGSIGWVKSAFLVEEPPEKLLYYSVSEQNRQLQEEIETLKNTSASADPNIVSSNDAEWSNKITQLQASLDEQQALNQTLQQQINNSDAISTTEHSVVTDSAAINSFKLDNSNWIYLAIAAGLLIAGLLLGLKMSTWRMRKRLHGFRLD